jgi:hypothetical protein
MATADISASSLCEAAAKKQSRSEGTNEEIRRAPYQGQINKVELTK